LNNNVRILSLSYDSNIVASVHNDVIEIGKNLIQSLVTNSRYDKLLYLWTHLLLLLVYIKDNCLHLKNFLNVVHELIIVHVC
jgi:hypothetical protein